MHFVLNLMAMLFLMTVGAVLGLWASWRIDRRWPKLDMWGMGCLTIAGFMVGGAAGFACFLWLIWGGR